jgi:polysaccharide deacetylase 2 family uncharacterized protein YibQ
LAKARSRRKSSGSWFVALTLASMAALTGLGAFVWSQTGGGRSALLQLGAEQLFGEVQEHLEEAVAVVLPGLAEAAQAPDAHQWPLEAVDPAAAIRCRVVACRDDLSWWQIQEKVAIAMRQAGGRVLWGERLPRSRLAGDLNEPSESRDLMRLDLGVAGHPTHTLILYRETTPAPVVRWGHDPRTNAWQQLRERSDGPVVALVIDDWGHRQDATTAGLLVLDVPLTLAVLPGLSFSRSFALEGSGLVLPASAGGTDGDDHERAAAERLEAGCPVTLAVGPDLARLPSRRREIILHLPMQPQGYPAVDPGPRTLLVGMSGRQIGELLDDCLQSLPGVRGVNNHMGSAATADQPTMDALMRELAARDLLFLDSLTTAASVAFETARAHGLRAARNRIFLDHDHQDPESIRGRLRTLIRSARSTGFAIGIGHPHPATLQVLKQEVPGLLADGVLFVTISELLALQDAKIEQGV